MKTKITLLFALLLTIISFNAVGQNSKDEIYKKQIAFSEDFAKGFFESLKKNTFYEFKGKADKTIINAMTPATQKATYDQITQAYGELKELEYYEVVTGFDQIGSKIFRFKSTFEKNSDLEFRVVLNKNDLIAGFFIIPWKEKVF